LIWLVIFYIFICDDDDDNDDDDIKILRLSSFDMYVCVNVFIYFLAVVRWSLAVGIITANRVQKALCCGNAR
jgi:hypothetical protein